MRTSHAPPPLGPPNERLRQARQAAGFESAAAASTRFGWSENTYKSHENGMRGIRADVAEKYARAFQVSREWLLFGSDPGVPEATSLGGPSDIGPEIIPAQELVGTVADLPVYASAEGGADGEMIVETSPIEFVKRPEPLLTVRGGFAVYITGESMEPAYFRGDRALVHPSKPFQRGRAHLFVGTDQAGHQRALVKVLTSWTAEDWLVRQYNPAPGQSAEFSLSRTDWPKALLIVGKYDA